MLNITTHEHLPDRFSEISCELDLSPLCHVFDIYGSVAGAGVLLILTQGWFWTVSYQQKG